MKSRINVRVIVLLAGATLLSTGAMASPPSQQALTRSETIKYNPAKATTIEGATELYEKLRAAAAKVCSSKGTGYSAIDMQNDYDACVRKALHQAVGRVRSPLLTALHLQGAPAKSVSANRDASTIAQR
jgi:UrcA family protein